MLHYIVKKKNSWANVKLKATSFSRFFSFLNFCCINLKQVEKIQKYAEDGCIKRLSSLNFWFFTALLLSKLKKVLNLLF